MSDDLICVRCHQPVVTSRNDYALFERMHYVCFHFAFEHMGDPDDVCDDPSCPLRGRDLARAVEWLGAWLQQSTSHGLDMVRSRDGLNYVASTVDYVGGGYYHKRANGATPAAALIALAGEVGE